jgi:hypothetical protein
MPAVKTVGLLISAALALFGAGCSSACPTQPHDDPGRALSFYGGSRSYVRAIRAEARVEQWGRDGRIKGTVLMFVQRPESVRFDAMTQMGPASILTSDGRLFALTDLRENRYLTGPTCPENIARLLGIPMSGEQVTLFLLGSTPRIDATDESIECSDDGTYLITLRGPGGERQEIEIAVREADLEAPPSEQRLRLVRSELFDSEGTVWRATFDDWRVLADPGSAEGLGVAMPFEVRFEHPRENADTTVKFEDVDLNVEVPAEAFQQTPRPGLPVEEVPCDGG